MSEQFSINDGRNWKTRFFTIWGGQAISIFGSQLVQFALIWHLTSQTGSATVLAIASLVGMLPSIIFGPFIGTLVDRWNRRWIMLFSDSIVALATIILAGLFSLGFVEIWHIYLLLFVRSLAGCFQGNAMTASTSLMVPVEHLTRIQGINQMLNGGLNIISAPLGAVLLLILPLQGILAIDVVTAMFAILPMAFSQIPQPQKMDHEKFEPFSFSIMWQDFTAGLNYLLRNPGLLIIGLMTVGINFTIIPAFSLLPLLVKEFFGGSAIQLGWME
jgi:DHA3 family macrolide efflux protein-like MFS transporter